MKQHSDVQAGAGRSPSTRVQHWSWGVVLHPATICCLILLVFLQQLSASNSLRPLVPPGIHTKFLTKYNPDISRPLIELHPESHVYREPITQHLDWVVIAHHIRPDGVLKRVFHINDLFPGPTVEARSGDRLIINVANSVPDESISLHWHGLHTESKCKMDGTVGVTQNPILPGTTFTYNFTIPTDQSGTFWYHAHSGLSRADGLYGGLIVHAPLPKSTVRGLLARADNYGQESYSEDILLLVGDWYHSPADQVYAWYMRAGSFGNEPVPDSFLVNGVGHFNCSMAVPARPLDCVGQKMDLSYLNIDKHTHSRIRIVNTGSLAGFTLEFQDRDFTLIQVDSVDVEAKDSNSAGILYPGQRMDILLRPSNNKNADSMTVHLDRECFKYPNPTLTPVQTFPISSKPLGHSFSNISSLSDSMSLSEVATARSVLSALPENAHQTHVVYTKIEKLSRNHNVPYGFFNRTSWKPQTPPLIELPRENWDENQLVMSTGSDASLSDQTGTWVDLVVNNLDDSGHPFHLHGHHPYILNVYQPPIGWGSYNPFTDAYPPGLSPSDTPYPVPNPPYDLTRAQLRDTVHIPRRGYAVLRFRADNPGVWLFHCHILWHSVSGMAMLVQVD
ncbi:hypothetical protein BO71DRAFT_456948 [Aspergillus ellipticus CBS 707.79]|uniref:Laccase n=1 Tax=Aspergillus ellipticus CBS 707.79 TaxID=1448320 RepID=A0A319D5T1_9EURO|nr:hypothetical protein BO71DRAFT_456948 [Aspergillus ellipticus CBS 707.79]